MTLPQLSATEHSLLELLVAKPRQYGFEIVKNSNGKLKQSTVYVLLDRLEKRGFAISRREPLSQTERGVPRRLYRATSEGERLIAALRAAENIYRGGDQC